MIIRKEYHLQITLKSSEILFNMKDGDCVTDLFKKMDITYSHIKLIIDLFVENKILTEKKEGRHRILFLTHLGEEIQYFIRPIIYLERRVKNENRLCN